MHTYLRILSNSGIMNKLIILITPLVLLGQGYNWSQIHDTREYSISGVALFNDGYIVVHDNKKKNQARVSFVDEKLKISRLVWPEPLLPFDLEAVEELPNYKNRFILMESTGKCYEVYIDPIDYRIDVLNTFTLPGLRWNMNLEGLTIYDSSQGLVFIYGDRGSDTRKSKLITVFFNHKKIRFYDINSYTLDLKEPMKNKRNIADLSINQNGDIWTSATSDPGNNGPFSTALYDIGKINPAGKFELIHPDLQKPVMIFKHQKVEAMLFHDSDLILMTDNENFGSTFLLIKTK